MIMERSILMLNDAVKIVERDAYKKGFEEAKTLIYDFIEGMEDNDLRDIFKFIETLKP